MIDLSIIVPIYHTPINTILRCLNSIDSSRPSDISIECLLVFDGTINEYNDISLLPNKYSFPIKIFGIEHIGVSGARNHGINHAQGEWVTFVDSDDIILLSNITSLISIGNQMGDDFVLGQYQVQMHTGISNKKN